MPVGLFKLSLINFNVFNADKEVPPVKKINVVWFKSALLNKAITLLSILPSLPIIVPSISKANVLFSIS